LDSQQAIRAAAESERKRPFFGYEMEELADVPEHV